MLGYEPHELPDHYAQFRDLLHPEVKPTVTKVAADFFENPEHELHTTFRMRCKDGGYKWILSRGTVVEWDEAGKPKRIIGTHMDVDMEKKLEQQLTEANHRLRHEQNLMLQCGRMAAIVTWRVDLKHETVYWSEKTRECDEPGRSGLHHSLYPRRRADIVKLFNDSNTRTHHLNQITNEAQKNKYHARENYENNCILVVDDHEINQIVIKGILEEHSIKVIMANDGQQAIDTLQNHACTQHLQNGCSNSHVDLVPMDYQMPVLNGYSATKKFEPVHWEIISKKYTLSRCPQMR